MTFDAAMVIVGKDVIVATLSFVHAKDTSATVQDCGFAERKAL